MTPRTAQLPGVIDTVASWQHEGFPVQVHPGDLGWYQRFGAEELAGALRLWELDGSVVAAAGCGHATLSAARWQQMAEGHAYRHARCLVGYDQDGTAVAASPVWSAGNGRPGAIEPLGVHGGHRGRGHGAAITLAAAQALRSMGCSSATVATPSSNVPAVATYEAAGFTATAHDTDFCRP
ncbi:MAG TPA: GNAT family N-acetyltransferase [Ruania sp.]|nr:GNAT family N-acetyltransferase [Ruania sp.]